jgi:3',5'-cyclic AMP phosphodiesterase CpdA
MTNVRILHISDLHLAEQANRRSILDRSAAVRTEIEQALATDIKDSVLKGDPHKLRSAFKNLLTEESVAELLSARRVSREQINDAIDEALKKIVLGDGSFKRAAVEFLRDQTIASSFDLRFLYCLCQFIEDEEPNLKAILITGDLATTGFKGDLARGLSFLEGPSVPSIANVPYDKKLLLPGNHDRYEYTDDGFLYAPGGKLFDTTFGNYWSGSVRAFEPLRDGKLSVIIIAADFGLQSKHDCTFPLLKISRLAQGRVYKHIGKNW